MKEAVPLDSHFIQEGSARHCRQILKHPNRELTGTEDRSCGKKYCCTNIYI